MTTLPSQFQPVDARSYVNRRLGAALAKATATTLYEVPADSTARVDTVFITSVHSGNETVRLHHVRPGEDASTSNALYYDLSVAAKATTVLFDAGILMTPGDRLVMVASHADRICVTVYGAER
jgi:hypothetical protein